MKVYVAGKITGFDEFKEKFAKAQQELEELGHVVMNPAILPPGFEQDEYMHVCYAMIDVCEGVYFLDNWMDSKCATLEYNYALQNDKWMLFEDSKGMARECMRSIAG